MTAVVDAPAVPGPTRRRPARSRRLIGLAVLLLLVVVAALASIAVGTRSIGLDEVWRALFDGGLSTEEAVIVRQLRVPRTALGLLVGLALGVAGALMQGHTRNPLGDPGLLGVTAGASLAVVVAIAWFGIATPSGYVWFAFAGALAGTVLVYAIGSAGRGGPTPVTLALAGAALSALLYALVRAVLVSDQQTLDSFRFWVVGALAGRGADIAWQVAPFIAVGLLLAVANAPALEPARARRGRRPRSRPARLARPRRRPDGDHAAVRGRDRRVRADRVRRAGRAARRPRVHRPRPPLADPLLGTAGRRPAADRRRHRPDRRPPRRAPGGHRAGPDRGPVLHRAGAPPPDGRPVTARTTVRIGPASAVLRWRQLAVPLVALVVLVLLSAVSLGRGDFPIGIGDVLRTLAGLGEKAQEFIVLQLRAPRIVVGLLVGLALGVAGALFQTFARNPLASPDVLGITQGASVGAVAAIVLTGGGVIGVPLAALAGALLTGALLFVLTWRAGIDGYRLVLVGIALWSAMAALTDWLLTNAEIYDAAAAYVWITGSLNARTWDHAVPLALSLLVLVPLALAAGRVLGVLQFGDDQLV